MAAPAAIDLDDLVELWTVLVAAAPRPGGWGAGEAAEFAAFGLLCSKSLVELRTRAGRGRWDFGDALGRSHDEIKAYDGVVARYGDAPEPALREQVARALDTPILLDNGPYVNADD